MFFFFGGGGGDFFLKKLPFSSEENQIVPSDPYPIYKGIIPEKEKKLS